MAVVVEENDGCCPVADKGNDSNIFRRFMREKSNVIVTPIKRNRKVKINYDKDLYKMHLGIVRLFEKIKKIKPIFPERNPTRYCQIDN